MTPIIRKELRDALRDRWLIGYTLLLAVVGLVAAVAGLRSTAGLGLQMFGRTTATLTNLCLMVAPLVALSMGAASIARERDQGTLEHLLAQPISRQELLLGKYLGLLVALLAATLAGFAPAGVMVAAAAGPASLVRYLLFPLIAGLLVAATLGIGLLISLRSRGGAQAQGRAILLWFVLVLVYDLLLMGTLVAGELPAGVLAALLLLNPVDAARVLAVLGLEPDLYLLGPAGAVLLGALSVPGTVLVLLATLTAWSVAPLGLALRAFRLRPVPATRPPAPQHDHSRPAGDPAAAFPHVERGERGMRILTFLAVGGLCVGLAACAGANGASGGAAADAGSTAVTVTDEVMTRGNEIYQLNCAPCHGELGKGDGRAAATLEPPPRDHSNPELMDKLTDQRIAETIQKGGAISGYPTMPSHPHIRGDDLVAVVAFVRSLHRPAPPEVVDLEGYGSQ